MRKCSITVAMLLGAAVLAIVGYNFYVFRIGACPCQEFWTPTMLVVAAALLLLVGLCIWLLFCKQPDTSRCPRCNRNCRSDWSHCPDCGEPLSAGTKETYR